MSANFLDKSGLAAGIDAHMYFTVAPPPAPPVPVPVPMLPHSVGSAHFAMSRSWRIAHSVTTDGWAVLQSSWAMILVPHGPLTGAPPHPAAEIVNIAAIILTSSAAPQLTAHSVSGEGGALCTAILGCWGLNLDCGDAPVFGASHDLNLNSVKTSPTLGDYVAALLSAVLNMLYSWKVGDLISKNVTALGMFEKIFMQALAMLGISTVQTVLDAINSLCCVNDPVALVIGWVTGLVQGAIDAPAK